MKAVQQSDTTQKLMGEARLARLNLAKAESELTTAKELARLARQRRKEAKRAARRAKKRARQAKENVAGAKLALEELEARLARPHAIKANSRPRRKPVKKIAAAPRRKSPVAVDDAKPPVTLKVTKPVVRRTRSKRKLSPAGKAAKKSAAVSRDLEAPIAMIPPEVSKATVQIVKEIEGIFTGETETGASVETGAQASIAPPDKNPSPPNHDLHNEAINTQETP
jgi:hypothetical protein